MKEKVTKRDILNSASLSGAVLGGVTIGASLISQNMAGVSSSFLIMMVTALLWTAKFIGCIYIMRHFMKKLTEDYSGASNGDTFRQGIYAALFSAILIAAYNYLYLSVINPEYVENTMNTMYTLYQGMLDSNSLAMLEKMASMNLAAITSLSQLVYCFLYGTILSSILSRNVPSRNPFMQMDDNQEGSEN